MKNIFDYVDNFKINEHIKSELLFGDKAHVPNPKFSVVMPVFKRTDFFLEALNSALNQDIDEDYEIVVVDNNDEDPIPTPIQKIVEKVNDKRILYYRNQKNLGMMGNWNRCVELARAPFFTFCHDDDMLLPNCLSRLAFLQRTFGNSLILSNFNIMDENSNITSASTFTSKRKFPFLKSKDHYRYTLFDQMLGSRGFGVGCLFSKQCMLDIGGYNSEFYPSSDYALQTVYTRKFGCVINNIPTFNYRVAQNESLNTWRQFCEVDLHFRKCMTQYINLPNVLLAIINNANYRVSKLNFAVNWGKQDATILNQIRVRDKLVLKLCNLARLFNKFKISIF